VLRKISFQFVLNHSLKQLIFKEFFLKKVSVLLLVLMVTGGFVFSADFMDYPSPLKGGSFLTDVGIGWAFASGTGTLITSSVKIPPIILSSEYCLPSIPISIGGIVGFYQYEWRYSGITNPWAETWTYVTFGARANWHWNIGVSWFDLYTGVFVGYTYFSWSSGSNPYTGRVDQTYRGVDFGGHVGTHFYLAENIGVVTEWGYPFVTKAGLALKF
jgi:hypothetical protein